MPRFMNILTESLTEDVAVACAEAGISDYDTFDYEPDLY